MFIVSGMFPEDYEIRRSELVGLWVAEGFAVDKHGSSAYDIGDRYFNELVNRSMIMPVQMDEYGVATACRVHDMTLDLIISLSAQENFCTIPEVQHHKSTSCKIRRISLQGEQKTLPTKENMSHARSLIVFRTARQGMPPLSKFSVLRVLYCTYSTSEIIQIEDLGSLHHLRYLKLCDWDPKDVLEGIGNLKLLKTLDLTLSYHQTCHGELPACIGKFSPHIFSYPICCSISF
ncbi:unnamed protein product [Urochloa humidicola]